MEPLPGLPAPEKVQEIRTLTNAAIKSLIREEEAFEVTRSLVTILHNILEGNLSYTRVQRRYLTDHSDDVHDLLDEHESLRLKQEIFANNPSLVRHVAASCPSLVG